MRLVIVESPYAGDVEANLRYLDACILDCLRRGESPYASHRMLTSALRDALPEERTLGIAAGFCWREAAALTAVYIDRGVSAGMRAGVADALAKGHRLEFRSLEGADVWAVQRDLGL